MLFEEETMTIHGSSLTRRTLLAAGSAAAVGLAANPLRAATSGAPIRIGGTLALTGPLSATAQIHKSVGELYVDQLNAGNGLLGRPVEWVLKDDQSKPDLARTLYEQLITVDKVDMLMGPYATGAIISAMAVAQRYNKMLVHHTMGIPSLAKYSMQFPAWSLGPDPGTTTPSSLFDMMAASPKPPKRIAIVTSKFPSVYFMAQGAREVAKKRGLEEALWLEWEFGNRDYGPIASRIKDANPDFIFIGDIGLDGTLLLEAMTKIDYKPPMHYHLYPSPAPLAKAPEGQGALAGCIFEEHPPFTDDPVAAKFIEAYHERAKKAGLPDTFVETQAAVSYTAWQILQASIEATKSLDDKACADYLRTHRVKTIQGDLRFDGPSNYGDDLMKVKQVQNGKWVTVWPAKWAAPGAKLMVD